MSQGGMWTSEGGAQLSRSNKRRRLGCGSIATQQTSKPNTSIQRTRATKRLGVFRFRGVARGADRGRYASKN